MKKQFKENPILFDILANYKTSELSQHLSFYEYCQVTLQVNQVEEVSGLVDQFRIDQSMREHFAIEGADDAFDDEL